jgi:D-alanyl-D-alanine carboxypeptidase
LYRQFVAENGEEMAALYVLPPGTSEHHTGLSVDFSSVSNECAADSDSCSLSQSSAAWLKENASRFGFIQRYPAGAKAITGVGFEPWHYRYVGKPLAEAMATTDLTLEEVTEKLAPGYARVR